MLSQVQFNMIGGAGDGFSSTILCLPPNSSRPRIISSQNMTFPATIVPIEDVRLTDMIAPQLTQYLPPL